MREDVGVDDGVHREQLDEGVNIMHRSYVKDAF